VPLAIDLFCGLGGWTEGLLSEGWNVRGYDIEAHEYGEERYPAELILRNVLEMHGSEIADADLIVASPPCTEYSYMAMPWTRAKQIARALRGQDEFPEPYRGSQSIADLNALFDACFRLQREASAVAGRQIPMIVENVKGAQPWVGRAAWSFGSFFLWGDIPALMPVQRYHERLKVKAGEQWNVNRENFTGTRGWDEGTKNTGGSWFNIGSPGQKVVAQNPDGRLIHRRNGAPHTKRLTNPAEHCEGVKQPGISGTRDNGKGDRWFQDGAARHGSKSSARKAASAKIAKIPLALSSHIARVYKPKAAAA
jgi:hypothetical protein